MIFDKAVMLNKKAKEDSQKVMNVLNIKQGYNIADIGTGGGYFAELFSSVIGKEGIVFAVDTDLTMLAFVEENCKIKNINNIKTLIGNENSCELENNSCDIIFMRNVYHHLSNKVLYFEDLKNKLKKDAKLVIIDWNKDANAQTGSEENFSTAEEIQDVMKLAGYKLIESFDFLSCQTFDIFKAI